MLKGCPMKLTKREDGWWITNWPKGFLDCGPYGTRGEASEDLVRLTRTMLEWDEQQERWK
jgi:hypothetical protein